MENLASQKQRCPASDAAPGSVKWWLGTSLTRVTLRTPGEDAYNKTIRCRSRLTTIEFETIIRTALTAA